MTKYDWANLTEAEEDELVHNIELRIYHLNIYARKPKSVSKKYALNCKNNSERLTAILQKLQTHYSDLQQLLNVLKVFAVVRIEHLRDWHSGNHIKTPLDELLKDSHFIVDGADVIYNKEAH